MKSYVINTNDFRLQRSLETMVVFKEWRNRDAKPNNLRMDKTDEFLERSNLAQ